MQPYYKERRGEIAHFKAEARKAFVEICAKYGLLERKPRLPEAENHFQTVFSNRKIRVQVEGINWGMNSALTLGLNRKDARRYDIHELMCERKPALPISGTQTEQLYLFARYLRDQLADVLGGDCRLFEILDARAREMEKEREAARQAEIKMKMDQGYIKITNPFGDDILRKPRGPMPDYETLKRQFPQAREVGLMDFADLFRQPMHRKGSGGLEGVITAWYKEVGECIAQGEPLCSFGMDKAEVEIEADVPGKVIWHLPEGTIVQASSIVALLLPENQPGQRPENG